VPHRGKVLQPRNEVVRRHQRLRPTQRGQSGGVIELHAFGSLKEHEMSQGLLAERE
jgi:hypothetical protein